MVSGAVYDPTGVLVLVHGRGSVAVYDSTVGGVGGWSDVYLKGVGCLIA